MSETTAPTQTQVLAPVYTCHVCRRSFSNNAPTIIGQKPIEKAIQSGQLLMDHFMKQHQDEMKMIALGAQEYLQWLVMQQFRHDDTLMNQHSETVRKNIRRITCRVLVTDEIIEAQVDQYLENAPDMRASAIALLKTLRNTLMEGEPPKP